MLFRHYNFLMVWIRVVVHHPILKKSADYHLIYQRDCIISYFSEWHIFYGRNKALSIRVLWWNLLGVLGLVTDQEVQHTWVPKIKFLSADFFRYFAEEAFSTLNNNKYAKNFFLKKPCSTWFKFISPGHFGVSTLSLVLLLSIVEGGKHKEIWKKGSTNSSKIDAAILKKSEHVLMN